jgi:hypothetical protein
MVFKKNFDEKGLTQSIIIDPSKIKERRLIEIYQLLDFKCNLIKVVLGKQRFAFDVKHFLKQIHGFIFMIGNRKFVINKDIPFV